MGFRRRLLVLLLVTAAGLAVVWGRMFQLQVVEGEASRERAEAATRRRESVLGPRGRILDAKGEALATDQTIVQLVFSPAEWATRERFRCRRCGTMLFARTPRYFDREGQDVSPPRGCSCGAKRADLEPVPPEDLEPLETVLHLPPGTLASEAEDRLEEIARRVAVATTDRVLGLSPGVRSRARALLAERGRRPGVSRQAAEARLVDEVLESHAAELAEHAFEVEDVRFEERTDRLGRRAVLTELDGPGGVAIPLKDLPPEAERLLELDRDGRYRGFRAEVARRRWYPHHQLLAQVIGITGAFASAEELQSFRERFGAETVLPETRVGRMGLEARYDDELRGQPGVLVREKDAGGSFTKVRVERPPVRGRDLRLWSTVAANEEAHRLLADAATDDDFAPGGLASSAFIALDAETGHVLACGETPVYELNGSLKDISKRVDDGDGGTRDVVENETSADPAADPEFFSLAEPKPGVALSRVFRIAVEPGSSFKLVTALALLHSGHPIPTGYECVGERRGEHDTPKCHNDHRNEPIDVVAMLRHSCNRFCADGASDRAYVAGHAELFPAWAHTLGFERPSGVDFPGAGIGRYPKALDRFVIRQVAIGQAVTVTPVQMARLAALVANGRHLPFPRIVASVGDEPVRDGGTEVDLDPGALAKVREGMRECVESGTAKGKFVGMPGLEGVTVYGKTGTAIATGGDWVSQEVEEAERRRVEDDPKAPQLRPYHLWFVGYATKPGTPTIAFACVLHARKMGAGGDVAAPVVQRFLSWWYAR